MGAADQNAQPALVSEGCLKVHGENARTMSFEQHVADGGRVCAEGTVLADTESAPSHDDFNLANRQEVIQ